MRDVTMDASRQSRSIWWRFWTYFAVNTFDTKLYNLSGRPGAGQQITRVLLP